MGEEETSKQVYESCKVTSDACPACKLKGLTHPLQVYRISFKESIILCENPQCIYPLGHKPLHSITTSARDLINQQTKHSPRKRKSFECSPRVPLKKSPSRSIGQCVEKVNTIPVRSPDTSLCTSLGQNGNISEKRSLASNGLSGEPSIHVHSGSLEDSVAEENSEAPQNSIFDTEVVSEKATCSKSQTLCNKVLLPKLQGRTLHLQWRNEDALCWLDCILSSFVNLRTLREAIEVSTEEHSILKQLFSKYDHANALQTYVYGKDGNIAEISLEVLVQAEKQLNEIRLEVFNLLQPQLKCQLGKNDMPVFALPLLLKKDPSFQNLFMHSFAWKFECLLCGYKSQDRCSKTLTTFTKVFPEWHPLHAVHVAPCNNCLDQSQRREMVLEKVPAVFMLHFSEGLPHGNLKDYSFQFEGGSYEVTVVIQYQTNHFATWVLTPDDSWLECDDLKGPYCWCHETFGVPPSEIHIVFWERKNIKHISEFKAKFQHEHAECLPLSYAQSISSNHCDEVHRGAPTAMPKDHISDIPSTMSQHVTSGEVESCFGFKNLKEDDVITLTLVEVPTSSMESPHENHMVMGMGDMLATCALQQQEKESASLLTSCQGRSLNTLIVNDSEESQNPVMCMLSEKSDPKASTAATFEKHSTYLPPIVHPPELSNVETQKHVGNSVITHKDPPFSPTQGNNIVNTVVQRNTDLKQACKNIVENGIANHSPVVSKNLKKGFASNWVNGLIGRHSVLPSSLIVSNQKPGSGKAVDRIPQVSGGQGRYSKRTPLKATCGQLLEKGPSNFGGFTAKTISRSTNGERASPSKECGKLSCSSSANITSPLEHFTCTEQSLGSVVSPSACKFGAFQSVSEKSISHALNESLKHAHISNGHQKLAQKNGDSGREHKIHRLRLKLLRKLKAKKHELSSLDMLANELKDGNSVRKLLKNPSHPECTSKRESLHDLLKALQEHIDNVDKESVYTMSSNNSLCSSPGDAEFLADLLSPAPIPSLEMRTFGEDGTRLLEMLVEKDNGVSLPTLLSNGLPSTIDPGNGHNDYYPKGKGSVVCSNSVVNGSSFSYSNCDSSVKEDVLEDLLSSSFSCVGDDTALCHFDEHFFESG
ncbi:SUMO-specific isopeptidase USPL1 isoform X2 [Ambystoma mexicanum]|uniref:SUMO-specific isopeptidase USPL1 isoform X2 n=1 Tax=Ambystoma mexicanum TaxID=8296 RepID=UPI0037E97D5D